MGHRRYSMGDFVIERLKKIGSRKSGVGARVPQFIIHHSAFIILFLSTVYCLPSAAFAQRTLYFTKSAIATNVWKLSESSPPGPADSTSQVSNASDTTGWYHVDAGLSDNTADPSEFSDTHPPDNTLWVSEGTYSGDFASGNWVFTLRKSDNKSGRVGYAHVDLFRSSSQTNQSAATFIADCTNGSDDWTGGAATLTVTCSTAGTTTLSGEYLVVHLSNNVSSGGTGTGTWSFSVEDTTNGFSKLVTPAFTPTTPARNRVVISGLGTREPGVACRVSGFLKKARVLSPEFRFANFDIRVSNFGG